MKICQFSSVHTRKDVRVFYKECKSLAERSFEVHLVLADGLGNARQEGVIIHDLGKASSRLARILFSPLRVMLKVLSLRADINHFHDPELLPVAVLIKLLRKTRVVYDVHESYPEDFLQKEYLPEWSRRTVSRIMDRLELACASRFDGVVSATSHIAKRFEGLRCARLTLNNYPMLAEFECLDAGQDRAPGQSFCYVGSITYARGLYQVLQALGQTGGSFHLAGAYEPAGFREKLMRLPGWKQVTEYGFVNRAQAGEIIQSSLFGVILLLPLPNHIHALPTKAFEYLAGAIPVLVPDFPIWQEIVGKYRCGICVDPLNVEAIAQAIRWFYEHPREAREMGLRGREMVLEEYNWERQKDSLPELYSKIMEL